MTIAGGTATRENEFPHLISFQYNKPGYYPQHLCGGTIIASKWIVTAAHCLDINIPQNEIQIVAGTYNNYCYGDNTGRCITRTVVRKIKHPSYGTNGMQHDIGLLELNQELPLAQFPNKVKVASLVSNTNMKSGMSVIIAGWGRTIDSSSATSRICQKANVPLQTQSFCASKGVRMTDGIQLCAGNGNGVDACQGDSGGPLGVWKSTTNNFVLMGIVSYGPSGCGRSGSVGAYTNVGNYISWIRGYVGNVATVSV
ncbi:hypothetical protein ABK040_006254 [Willaertia magna]